jgi:hypothetical protein
MMSSEGRGIGSGAKASFRHRAVIAIAYVILVAGAELLTSFAARHGIAFAKYGIVFHALILFALLIHSALLLTADPEFSRLLMVLILAPLIRILSLVNPVAYFSYIIWFAIISIPVYIAIFTCMYIQHLKPRDVALTLPKLKYLPLEVAVILLAFPFGILEYHILKPGILVEPSFEALIIPVLIMIVCTGFLEELAFRGLMHTTRQEQWGSRALFSYPFSSACCTLATFPLLTFCLQAPWALSSRSWYGKQGRSMA